ncbi:MAG: apolipoprotein N-acyltransferase [Gammaproteobacteria bacterium]|nr:apolipoprotein N-acyltransferase [Gammaproteobacteria bacterium]
MRNDLLAAEPKLPKRQLLLAALVGAALPLAYAPFGYGWIMPIMLAVLMLLQYGKTPRQAFKLGVVFGTPGFIGGLYWIYISTHVYTGAPAPLSIFLIFLLSLYLSLYGAITGAVAAWFGNDGDSHPPVFGYWLVAYVVAWPLLELLRNFVLTGFPWFALGYTQTDSWLNGWAPITGVFGMAIPVLLLAAIPVAFRQGRLWTAAVPAIVLVASGYGLQQYTWTQADGEPLKVGIVQGNIEQDQKWVSTQRWPTVKLYRELTERLIPDADLIIWPEVAIPGAYREFQLTLFGPLAAQLDEHDADLLAGIMRWDDDTHQYANAVAQVKSTDPVFYDKQHLVPFAEYFPVPGFVRDWLRALELPFTDLYTGNENRMPFQVGEHRVAMSICFEDVFGEEVALLAKDASLLANVSNDAWFGRSIAAAQHEQIARMRALETQRWMVRATPTGFSAFINPQGSVVQRLPRGEVATSVAELQPRTGLTPYMLVRNYWMAGLLVVLLLLLVAKKRRQRSRAFYT